jgi:hypothetical protein
VTRSRFFGRRLPEVLFAVLLAAAFSNGLRTTWGVQFPDIDLAAAGVDLYRDMGLAQTMLDSGYGPDPAFLGERSWFNPLAPGIIAAVSDASGWPVHVVVTQIGTRDLAVSYDVTHVVTRGSRSERYDVSPPQDLRLGFQSGSFRVFLVTPDGLSATSPEHAR